MADQSIRHEGLKLRDNRREAVADLNLANQLQQPARSPEPPGTNLRTSLRSTQLNRPPAYRPQTRLAGGNAGVQRGVSGGLIQNRPRLGGQFLGRDEEANQIRNMARQTLAEKNPSYKPQKGGYEEGERLYNVRGQMYTFDEAKQLAEFRESQRAARYNEAKGVAEFHSDKAYKEGVLEATRAKNEADIQNMERDDKIEIAKFNYLEKEKRRLEAKQNKTDAEKAQVEALKLQMDAYEKDRRYALDVRKEDRMDLNEASRGSAGASGPGSTRRKSSGPISEGYEGYIETTLQKMGYPKSGLIGEDGEYTDQGTALMSTIDYFGNQNPDMTLDDIIPLATEYVGLSNKAESLDAQIKAQQEIIDNGSRSERREAKAKQAESAKALEAYQKELTNDKFGEISQDDVKKEVKTNVISSISNVIESGPVRDVIKAQGALTELYDAGDLDNEDMFAIHKSLEKGGHLQNDWIDLAGKPDPLSVMELLGVEKTSEAMNKHNTSDAYIIRQMKKQLGVDDAKAKKMLTDAKVAQQKMQYTEMYLSELSNKNTRQTKWQEEQEEKEAKVKGFLEKYGVEDKTK